MEVKLIAHHQAMSQAIWLRNFISSLKIVNSISKPIKINCDNFVAVFFSKNNKCSSKSKHIKLKYHVVRDKVQFWKVSIKDIDIDTMMTNSFAKALAPTRFKEYDYSTGLTNVV